MSDHLRSNGVVLPYLETSTLRPGLLEELPALRETFDARGAIRLHRVLEPGLAAELAVVFRSFPFGAQFEYGDDYRTLAWRCKVLVPLLDAQNARPLYRAIRFLDRDLPEVVVALTGRAVTPASSGEVSAWRFCKGTYLWDARPGLHYEFGLSGDRWPDSFGGGTLLAGKRWAPGFDTLDLIRGGAERPLEVPLVTRHVQSLSFRGLFAEET